MAWSNRRQEREESEKSEDRGQRKGGRGDAPKVKVIGDSIIRFIGGRCPSDWMNVHCFPGIRTEQLDRKIGSMTSEGDESVVLIHVGTNDVKGAMTNDHIIGFIWDLCTTAKKKFKGAKIVISGIIRRRDVHYKKIDYINEGIEWVCEKFGMTFVDPNCWIRDNHFSRAGVHLNRQGSAVMEKLFRNITQKLFQPGNL